MSHWCSTLPRTTILTLLLTIMAVQTINAEAVARILEVQGKVEVVDVQGKKRPAVIYGGVFTGEKLQFPPKGSVTIVWKSDKRLERVTVSNSKSFEVQSDGLNPAEDILPVALKAKASRQSMGTLIAALPAISPGGGLVPRSGDKEPAYPRIIPIKNSKITMLQPILAWPAEDGVKTYVLKVHESDSADFTWDTSTAETRLKYEGEALEYGKKYQWEVSFIKADKKAGKIAGAFTIASEEEIALLADIQILEKEAIGAKNQAILTAIANYYQRQSDSDDIPLAAEAIVLFEKLAEMQPEEPEYHAALAELYHHGGRRDAAVNQRRAAEKLGYQFKE